MKGRNIKIRKPMSVRSSAIYALVITAMIYLLFAVMLLYGRNAVIHADKPHHPNIEFSAYFMLFSFISTYIMLFSIYCINFKLLGLDMTPGKKTILVIVATIVFVILYNALSHYLQEFFVGFSPPPGRAKFGSLIRDMTLASIVVFASQVTYLNYRRQQMALENETLKAENARSRYEALRSQTDPHFLFNTLNTLNSMIKMDTDMAQEYVQMFSAVLRYTMKGKEVVTLADELAFAKDYCKLMQIRYGESLTVDFETTPSMNACTIAPLSIQMLLENAIKHNEISKRSPLHITVSMGDDSVIVTNKISPKKEPEQGEGIGLANLSERYRLKWGRDIVIRNRDGMFIVTIPLINPLNN